MSDYTKNFIIGAISGSVATLVSHPFFVIKNHVQNYNNINKIQYLKISWLYKGLTRSMVGYSIEKMVIFGVYNTMRQNDYNATVSGMISGIFASFTITPFEQLSIDKQIGVKNFSIKHLYKGLTTTMFREKIGFMVHFTVYDYFTSKYNKEKTVGKTLLCGIAAIVSAWSVITPIDRLKTQIQSNTFNYKEYNFLHSYKGFNYALMRAIPFHAVAFLTMETLHKF